MKTINEMLRKKQNKTKQKTEMINSNQNKAKQIIPASSTSRPTTLTRLRSHYQVEVAQIRFFCPNVTQI